MRHKAHEKSEAMQDRGNITFKIYKGRIHKTTAHFLQLRVDKKGVTRSVIFAFNFWTRIHIPDVY